MTHLPSPPYLGFGLGLRIGHYAHIFEHRPAVDWFEIISENFMDTDGKARRNLTRIREHYPLVMHGVALSIGTVDPLNSDYLKKLKTLMHDIEPAWVSDHVCWTGVAHKNTHDLLPVPYTEEALAHIVSRIGQVQDYLGRPLALENPSTYLEFKSSHIPEAEFIAEMAKRSGCQLLLDVNNVYVTCFNHQLNVQHYLDALPLDHVVQIHLAGHSHCGTHIIDTHDDHVSDEVWALYRYVLQKAKRPLNTMIEWDDALPDFEVLYAELEKAKMAAATVSQPITLPKIAATHIPHLANHPTPLFIEETRLQTAILNGEDAEPAAWIREKDHLPAGAQLDIYAYAYRARLRDSLAEDYSMLHHALGDEIFDALRDAFIEATPPTHFNIARYSALLPEFIARYLPENIFAQELAVLENAVTQIAELAETPVLQPAHVAGMDEHTLLQWQLHPRAALQLFAFNYSVNDYWNAVVNGQNPIPVQVPSHVAVFRHDDRVWRMDLEAQEYALLQLLFCGLNVGDALAKLAASPAEEEAVAAQISHWFGRWMRNGLLRAPQSIAEQSREVA